MNLEYEVIRPPLAKEFELPRRKDLLKLKPGNLVKIIFQVGNEERERMWVILVECSNTDKWTGVIDNDSQQLKTGQVLPAGKLVYFHPFDIIAID